MVRKVYIKESVDEQQGSINKLIRQLNAKINELEDYTYEECLDEGFSEEFNTESKFISSAQKNNILSVFDYYDVPILNYGMEDEVEAGILFHNFVVETDDMTYTTLENLERNLRKLESDNIGYERNYNGNGNNARTFYFYIV